MKVDFREDIQGLRAIAVISIIFYHLDFIEGGYLGVDIFFVISGFVITKSILNSEKSLKHNFFTYIVKRFKRLYLPLIITIILSSLLVLFFFIPNHVEHFSKSSIYSILFSSNIYFWQNTNHYFDLDKSLQPLLHTWSLGVEMQFYIFFGLIFFLFNRKFFILTLYLLFIFGLIISEANVEREMSFWLMPFRIFEFVIGSIIFFLPKIKINLKIENILSLLSLLTLIGFILYYDEKFNFPGINALYVCIATALIIYFSDNQFTKRILCLPILKYLGKISYSLYLIHWPLIVFYSYLHFQKLTFFDYFIIFIILIILSILSNKYLENFNFKKFRISDNNFILFVIISSIVLIIFSNFFILEKKYKLYSDNVKNMIIKKNLTIQKREKYLTKKTVRYQTSIKTINTLTRNKKNILVIGDSHSEDIFAGLNFNLDNLNYDIIWQHFPLACNQAIQEKNNAHISEKFLFFLFKREPWTKKYYNICRNYYDQLLSSKKLDYLDLIVISMMWDDDEIKFLDEYVEFFSKNTNTNVKIIFISKRISIPDLDRSILNNDDYKELESFLFRNKNNHEKFNKYFKDLISGYDKKISYFDINSSICTIKECNFIVNNTFNYVDYSHLSLNGSNSFLKNFSKYIKDQLK
jgi:peptidoglycan/LPS O-acetylase OafA/YrhL